MEHFKTDASALVYLKTRKSIWDERNLPESEIMSEFEVHYPFCARAEVFREAQGQRFTSPKLIVLLFRTLNSNVKFMARG